MKLALLMAWKVAQASLPTFTLAKLGSFAVQQNYPISLKCRELLFERPASSRLLSRLGIHDKLQA